MQPVELKSPPEAQSSGACKVKGEMEISTTNSGASSSNNSGSIELKLTAIASTRLICKSYRHWGKMLDSIVTLFSRSEQDRVEEEPEVPDFGGTVSYNATSVHLYNAGKKEEDYLKDIKDPKQYLVAILANISAQSPGRYPQLIRDNLEQANQAALLQFCGSYNCSIV